MDSFSCLREDLRRVLPHLHDPDCQPTELLWTVTGCSPEMGVATLQSAIIDAIKDLEPENTPPEAPTMRDYDVLHHRFVLRLTQEEAAERLHMSVRSLRRAQRAATHTLARLLWERSLARTAAAIATEPDDRLSDGETEPSAAGPLDWQSQLQNELAALRSSSPASIVNVGKTIQAVVELESVLTSKQDITLDVRPMEGELLATVHPSVLRQSLIMTFAQLARVRSAGKIAIRAQREGGEVVIALCTQAAETTEMPKADLIRELLLAEGGDLVISIDAGRISYRLKLPSAGEVNVLVVDDNPDSIHFYRRCTAGTRFRITSASQGQGAIEAIQSAIPDVIVLDIMLPDADGWELLSRLRSDPKTQSIPVIVCSVVREEDLAAALGAVLYLPKPVNHRDFIAALDQAVSQGPVATTRPGASNPAAC